MAALAEAVVDLFHITPDNGLQAQFFSSQACTIIEKELAEAQICYKTTIIKSKKRGLVYVIDLLEPLGPFEPAETPRGSGD
jgi:hypothetical protein